MVKNYKNRLCKLYFRNKAYRAIFYYNILACLLLSDVISGFEASIIRNIAESICRIIPTNGIHAKQDVTIPKILPVDFPPSFLVRTRVTICKTNIITKGAQSNPRIIEAPRTGIAKVASRPPETHFNILDDDINKTQPSNLKIWQNSHIKHYNIFIDE